MKISVLGTCMVGRALAARLAARATEMYMPLYFTLVGVLESFDFNVAVVRAATAASTSLEGES
jgi:hypothetical protein